MRFLSRSHLIFASVAPAFVQTSARPQREYADYIDLTERGLSLEQYVSVILTELQVEFDLNITDDGIDQVNGLLKLATVFEWKRSEQSNLSPFVLCNTTANSNGYDRLQGIVSTLDDFLEPDTKSYMEDETEIVLMYNRDDMTCTMTSLNPEVASEAAIRTPQEKGLIIQPIVSLSKMTEGCLHDMLERAPGDEHDNGENNSNRRAQGGASNNRKNPSIPDINVVLCHGFNFEEELEDAIASQTELIKEFMLAKNVSEMSFWNNFNTTDKEYDNYMETYEKRKIFWDEVYNKGINAADGHCVELLEHLEFEFSNKTRTLTIVFPDIDELGDTQRKQTKWCGLSLLGGLTLLHSVCFIEVAPVLKTANTEAAWITQSNKEYKYPWFDAGLTGEAQIVQVSDTGVDTENCYFRDGEGGVPKNGVVDKSRRKVVQYDPFVDDSDYKWGHGTHVCGTIIGQKSSDGINAEVGMADGVAKGAKLAFFDIGHSDGSLSVPRNVDNMFNPGKNAGARLHSASWGSSSNSYGSQANSFDEYVYENDDFLIVVAAGNSGGGNTPNSVGEPATAKNVIAVGATQSANAGLTSSMNEVPSQDYIASFSSRGPTKDGRIKPDLLAPGQWILSAGARPDEPRACDPRIRPSANARVDGVLSIQGTSMATPVVSGTAALVRQYFSEGFYPNGIKGNGTSEKNPSAALVKGILMNGAQDVVGVDNTLTVTEVSTYDNNMGFGRISLTDSLLLPGASSIETRVHDRVQITNKSTKTYSIKIDKQNDCNANEFSSTLVWTDPPASSGCAHCLINDLDLYVDLTKEGTNETIRYYPNGLSGRDDTNNVERVRLPANDGDNFTMTVEGRNLATSDQNYALVYTGCFAGTNAITSEVIAPPDNKTRNIIIGVVCGVGGAALIGGLGYYFSQKKKS